MSRSSRAWPSASIARPARRGGRRLDQIDYGTLEAERRAKITKVRADIARYRRDNKKAVELLTAVLKFWPHDAGVHESLAQSYAALGDFDAANRHLETGREIGKRQNGSTISSVRRSASPTTPSCARRSPPC